MPARRWAFAAAAALVAVWMGTHDCLHTDTHLAAPPLSGEDDDGDEALRWAPILARLANRPKARVFGGGVGVVVDDFVGGEAVEKLLRLASDALETGTCRPGANAEAVWCFDAARVAMDAATGEAQTLSVLPEWLSTADRVDSKRGTLCVSARSVGDAILPGAPLAEVDGMASVSFVSSRDEFDETRAVEAPLEDAGLHGENGLMQQLLYYPANARFGDAYTEHTDCRFDVAGAAAAAGGAVNERAFTTLLYLSDNSGGETAFPLLDQRVAPIKGRLLAWRNCLGDGPCECDAASKHVAMPVNGSPKIVLQRWYERRPVLAPPNAHGEAWTRCSLDESGEIESCRRYCATDNARGAALAAEEAHAAWIRYKTLDDASALDETISAAKRALVAQPRLASAVIVLAHALLTKDEASADIECCQLLLAFTKDYTFLGIAIEARQLLNMLAETHGDDCASGDR